MGVQAFLGPQSVGGSVATCSDKFPNVRVQILKCVADVCATGRPDLCDGDP